MPREPLNLPTDTLEAPTAQPMRRPRGPTQALHSEDLAIDQLDPVEDHSTYSGDIVLVDKDAHLRDPDFISALAFMEEPVTIRLIPSGAENAPDSYYFACNGKGAEIFQAGRWMEIGYLPVGPELTIRRKIFELVIRAKQNNIRSGHHEARKQGVLDEKMYNTLHRTTSSVCMFDLIEDRNPKGVAWLTEMRRRNF